MKRWEQGISKTRNTYPSDWRSRTKKVGERDGFKCFYCGITQAACLERYGKYLETHHLISVKTGNNRARNLLKLCPKCHSKQPGHGHLANRVGSSKTSRSGGKTSRG